MTNSKEYTAKGGTRFEWTRFESRDNSVICVVNPDGRADHRAYYLALPDLLEFARHIEGQHPQCSVCEGMPHHWREFPGWKCAHCGATTDDIEEEDTRPSPAAYCSACPPHQNCSPDCDVCDGIHKAGLDCEHHGEQVALPPLSRRTEVLAQMAATLLCTASTRFLHDSPELLNTTIARARRLLAAVEEAEKQA